MNPVMFNKWNPHGERAIRVRPWAARFFGVERLEPRALLAASPIAVIVIEASALAEYMTLHSPAYLAGGDLRLPVRSADGTEALYAPSYAVHRELLPLARHNAGSGGYVQPAEEIAHLVPPPVVMPRPPRPPEYAAANLGHAEGEASLSDQRDMSRLPAHVNPPLPPTAPAPAPAASPVRTAIVDAALSAIDLPLTLGHTAWTSAADHTLTKIGDWYGAAELDPLLNGGNLDALWSGGGCERRATASVCAPSWPSAEELLALECADGIDDLLTDALPPFPDELADAVPEADAGLLVDIDMPAGVLPEAAGSDDGQVSAHHAAPDAQACRVARDRIQQRPASHGGAQFPAVEPGVTAADNTRAESPRSPTPAGTYWGCDDEEGGMITSLIDQPARDAVVDEPCVAQPLPRRARTAVLMDAEVSYYQTFELFAGSDACEEQSGGADEDRPE